MDPISTCLNLECKGRLYPIRVYEEYNSENALFSYQGTTTNGAEEDGCSKFNHQPIIGTNLEVEGAARVDAVAGEYEMSHASMACRMKNKVGLEDGGSWSNASAVEETKSLGGNSNEDNTCVVESSSPEGSLWQKLWPNHINHTGMEVPIIEHNHDPQPAALAPTVVDSQILTPGFIKSLSGPSKINPGICLEVDLRSVPSGLQPSGPAHGCVQPTSSNNSFPYSPLFSAPINTRLQKGSKKVNKNPVFFGRFSGFAKFGQKSCGTSKGAMARSRAASNSNHNSQSQNLSAGRNQEACATSQLEKELGIDCQEPANEVINRAVTTSNHSSQSQSLSADRNQEAYATLQLGKMLGIDYKGQEAQVINHLTLMEAKDQERVGRRIDPGA
ncbi:unnamed protein product [Camellia sinensis]